MFVFPPCRARYTEASLTWRQSTTPQRPLWLWTTRMDSTQTRPMSPRTTASTTIPLSTQQTVPGSPRSNVSTQSLSFSGAFKDANKFQYRLNQYLIFHILSLTCLFPFSSTSSCNPREVLHAPPLCPLWPWWSSGSGSAQSTFSWTACSRWYLQLGGRFLTDSYFDVMSCVSLNYRPLVIVQHSVN